MKIKDGFILRKVGIQYVVAATGKASEGFNGMMRLNETGAFAFRLLQEGISEEALVRRSRRSTMCPRRRPRGTCRRF